MCRALPPERVRRAERTALKLYSVTEAISFLSDYSMVNEDVLAAAQARGTVVHAACAAYAMNEWLPVHKDYFGYVQSFRDWFDEYVVKCALTVEQRLEDKGIGIVGHPDLICRMKGDPQYTIVDLKTAAAPMKAWRLQMAMYRHLAEKSLALDIGRIFSLRLDPDGDRPKIREYTGTYLEDLAVFMSALNIKRWLDAA